MENQSQETENTASNKPATYYAHPIDISARGFFFQDAAEYKRQRKTCRNNCGEIVEEFEFSYHGDSDLDFYLFSALGIGQSTILPFIEKVDEWSEDAKNHLIVAVGECGMAFDIEADDPYDLDVDFYHDMNLIELARVFVDEGLFGNIPSNLEYYIDYDAMAADLAHDYTEILINGVVCVYRCV